MRWQGGRRSNNIEDRRGGGAAVPDSFTHGSSADRVHWFRRGMGAGDPASCDTFRATP